MLDDYDFANKFNSETSVGLNKEMIVYFNPCIQVGDLINTVGTNTFSM